MYIYCMKDVQYQEQTLLAMELICTKYIWMKPKFHNYHTELSSLILHVTYYLSMFYTYVQLAKFVMQPYLKFSTS